MLGPEPELRTSSPVLIHSRERRKIEGLARIHQETLRGGGSILDSIVGEGRVAAGQAASGRRVRAWDEPEGVGGLVGEDRTERVAEDCNGPSDLACPSRVDGWGVFGDEDPGVGGIATDRMATVFLEKGAEYLAKEGLFGVARELTRKDAARRQAGALDRFPVRVARVEADEADRVLAARVRATDTDSCG